MGVHNYRGHVYMSSLASLKSHWSSCGKTGKKLNTTPVPLSTKEGAFCTYLANKTNRAYARLEVYARLPGVKPENIPDIRLLREHTHSHSHTHTLCEQVYVCCKCVILPLKLWSMQLIHSSLKMNDFVISGNSLLFIFIFVLNTARGAQLQPSIPPSKWHEATGRTRRFPAWQHQHVWPRTSGNHGNRKNHYQFSTSGWDIHILSIVVSCVRYLSKHFVGWS